MILNVVSGVKHGCLLESNVNFMLARQMSYGVYNCFFLSFLFFFFFCLFVFVGNNAYGATVS